MLELIIKSIGLGLMLSLFIGPVFFLLVEVSSQFGIKVGYIVLAGALLSDVIFILLNYFFLDQLCDIGIPEKLIKITGGIIFMIFGITYFLRTPKKINTTPSHSSNFFLKGFLLNTFNPAIFFFWLGAVSYGASQFQSIQLIGYFLLALFIAISVDSLKIYFSIYFSKIATRKKLFNINKLTGSGLFVLGIHLIIQNLQ